jgi:hypothetical protein
MNSAAKNRTMINDQNTMRAKPMPVPGADAGEFIRSETRKIAAIIDGMITVPMSQFLKCFDFLIIQMFFAIIEKTTAAEMISPVISR